MAESRKSQDMPRKSSELPRKSREIERKTEQVSRANAAEAEEREAIEQEAGPAQWPVMVQPPTNEDKETR